MLDKIAAVELKNYILIDNQLVEDLRLDDIRNYAALYVAMHCSKDTYTEMVFSAETRAYCYGLLQGLK